MICLDEYLNLLLWALTSFNIGCSYIIEQETLFNEKLNNEWCLIKQYWHFMDGTQSMNIQILAQ